jgi:hypothetical protein
MKKKSKKEPQLKTAGMAEPVVIDVSWGINRD